MSQKDSHLSNHLQELRTRVVVSLLSIVIFSTIAYVYVEQIAALFMAPLFRAYPALAKLVYTNLTEAFISYIKVAILVGAAGSFPIIIYQVWMYIAPGLYDHEKRKAVQVVVTSSMLFIGGMAFSYYIVLPQVLEFFMQFASDRLEPLPKFGAYLTFVARTSIAFGLAFEIPFLMVVAGRSGLVKEEYFRKKRYYFYGAIAVISFLLTAGDLFAAFLLAVPLIGLYEIGVAILRMHKKKVSKE